MATVPDLSNPGAVIDTSMPRRPFTPGWADITGSPVVRGTGANDPNWTAFLGNISAYSFSATAMKEIWYQFHINHDYYRGTPIYPHVHWSTAGTNTGVVRWGFEYTYAKGHQQAAFPATTTIYVNQAAQGTAHYHMIAEVADADAIDLAAMEVDGLLLMRIFRDAANVADTCTDAAFLLTVDLHYQADRFVTPNKAPNFYA